MAHNFLATAGRDPPDAFVRFRTSSSHHSDSNESHLSMTDKLPPPLLALFQPRPPLRFIPPSDRAPEDCQKSTISGVAQYLAEAKKFEEEVPYNATDCWIQRKWRQKLEKKEQLANQLTEGLKTCMRCSRFPSLISYPMLTAISVK